jgi:hypothetical protein
MNVPQPHWACFFPKSSNPLTPTLVGTFQIPRQTPHELHSLLRRLERSNRVR